MLTAADSLAKPGFQPHQFVNEPLPILGLCDEVSVAPMIGGYPVLAAEIPNDGDGAELLSNAGMYRTVHPLRREETEKRLLHTPDQDCLLDNRRGDLRIQRVRRIVGEFLERFQRHWHCEDGTL